jgi:hypothetical protein
MSRWLREPLVHFLLGGLALFAGYAALHPERSARERLDVIEVTEDDLRQLDLVWMAKWQRHPTSDELTALVEDKVREEILYREALALGLDEGDVIVKRRLAQKLEFLSEDVSSLPDPTGAELESWFAQNQERFALPGRLSFRHLYFSPDRRGERARDDAAQALARITGRSGEAAETLGLGDPFMLQGNYADRSEEQLAKELGTPFAQALFQLAPDSWQGPIESGYGWHLVFLESVTPRRVPAFAEVEAEVRVGWLDVRRDELKRKAFEQMRARYRISVPSAVATGLAWAQPEQARALP